MVRPRAAGDSAAPGATGVWESDEAEGEVDIGGNPPWCDGRRSLRMEAMRAARTRKLKLISCSVAEPAASSQKVKLISLFAFAAHPPARPDISRGRCPPRKSPG